jgi:hypothetical protein
MIEYLILDYEREEEATLLLNSIKQYSKFPYIVTFLSNGGRQDYAKKLKEQGLINKLILNDVNVGCGAGTIQLFAQCQSKYAFYIQSDHILAAELNNEHIEIFIDLIEEKGFSYVDLAGDQCHGKYSERAQFISVEFYNSIPKSIGGPGPWHKIKWTEECIQNYIIENKLTYQSVYFNSNIPIFFNNGKWSHRSNPDGSMWKHRTDTKELWMIKKPTEKFHFPYFNDEEWELVLNNGWIDGQIPEKEKKHSFTYWQ